MSITAASNILTLCRTFGRENKDEKKKETRREKLKHPITVRFLCVCLFGKKNCFKMRNEAVMKEKTGSKEKTGNV